MGVYKKGIEVTKKQKELEEMRKQIKDNFAKSELLEHKLAEIKRELKNIRTQQVKYYHTLLSEGRDARQEGLAWIIKAIWWLGENVAISRLPSYLDPRAIEYLFKVRLVKSS